MDNFEYIIVIGASAGGFQAVTGLVSRLPEQPRPPVFVVMHLSKSSSTDVISKHLEKSSGYNCRVPQDGEPITGGTIYLAPADYHMLLKKDNVRLIKGPHENRYRPSIDVLFRSAAAAFDSRVIGIILSGMLDDGTSGMSAIKRSGGTCIVQEPAEAAYSGMPSSVLNKVEVDYQVPVADMGYILQDIFARPIGEGIPIPEDVQVEAAITERMVSDINALEKLGTHSNFTCPDCGGGLWKMNGEGFPRYRCHTGHVYNESVLLEKQNEELEESLWVSIRMLEERRNLLLSMFERGNTMATTSGDQLDRAAALDIHIERLKELLILISKQKWPPDEGYI